MTVDVTQNGTADAFRAGLLLGLAPGTTLGRAADVWRLQADIRVEELREPAPV